MDDLTELKGIGKSGAKVLAKAGLSDFAKIAAADPETRPDGLAASVDWDAVITEAKEFSKDTEINPEGRSGTAREAPSSGTAAEATPPIVGTQSAAQSTPEPGSDLAAGQSGSHEDDLTGEFLLVTGPKKGRWRAGRHITAEPRLLDLASLSDEELKLILEDDALSSEMLTGDEVGALQNEVG